MGVLDWIRGRRHEPESSLEWHVLRSGGDIVVQDGRGAEYRVPLAGARSVRVVPLTGGNHHGGAHGGWQVALAQSGGDVLVAAAMADWRQARELARRVCQTADLPLDELTEKMFSRVGTFTPGGDC